MNPENYKQTCCIVCFEIQVPLELEAVHYHGSYHPSVASGLYWLRDLYWLTSVCGANLIQ